MASTHINCPCGAKYMRKRGACPECGCAAGACKHDWRTLEAQLAAMRDALEKYGDHLMDCEAANDGRIPCTCDFDRALSGEAGTELLEELERLRAIEKAMHRLSKDLPTAEICSLSGEEENT